MYSPTRIESASPSGSFALRRRMRGLSLGTRLALGFGLISALFLIANYVSEKNAAAVAEKINRSSEINRQFDNTAHALTNALSAYRRAARTRITVGAGIEASSGIADAEAMLNSAVKEYAELKTVIPGAMPSAELAEAVDALQLEIRALLDVAREREEALKAYWVGLDRLQEQFVAWRSSDQGIDGRTGAQPSLLSVAVAILNVRNAVGEFFAAPNQHPTADVELQEKRLLATLHANSKSLIALRGKVWFAEVVRTAEDLQALERTARVGTTNIEFQAVVISAHFAKLAKKIETGISELGAKSLADSAFQATTITDETRRHVRTLSIGILALVLVIAVLTTSGVTIPVKRLINASRNLANGTRFANVQRGGVRELDQLAAAFNEMSERLEEAHCATQEQQTKLEQRVAERTQQLQHLAYHDVLTGLPNRRCLLDKLNFMLEQARHEHRIVALLLIDIDNFKTLNDGLGHLFGDRVLKAIGARLSESVGLEGIAARLGGDEFTVAVEVDRHGKDLDRNVERLLAMFDRPLLIDDREVLVGVSVGAAIFPDHASDSESLLSAADGALFKAKALGRKRAFVANYELLSESTNRFGTEQALRRALKSNELELFYQPQIHIDTGNINAVEALLRWKHNGKYVLPLEFLPVADQVGLLTEITDWALEQAIETVAKWRRGPWKQARIAINISAQQLIDQAFARRLQDLLARHGVPPSAVELELTETMLQTSSTTVSRLAELRRLGVGIALDDFGTGFSSLASLDQLELSRVKIDRSLIANVDRNPRSASIARSIIDLCQSLRLDVTIEGVERFEQLSFLERCKGIDVQGYLFSHPLCAHSVVEACNNSTTRNADILSSGTFPAVSLQAETATGCCR